MWDYGSGKQKRSYKDVLDYILKSLWVISTYTEKGSMYKSKKVNLIYYESTLRYKQVSIEFIHLYHLDA